MFFLPHSFLLHRLASSSKAKWYKTEFLHTFLQQTLRTFWVQDLCQMKDLNWSNEVTFHCCFFCVLVGLFFGFWFSGFWLADLSWFIDTWIVTCPLLSSTAFVPDSHSASVDYFSSLCGNLFTYWPFTLMVFVIQLPPAILLFPWSISGLSHRYNSCLTLTFAEFQMCISNV